MPISEATEDYATCVRDKFREAKFHVEVDLSSATMQKKVRTAQISQYNYILVVGEQEKDNSSVNVRTRDNVVHGMHKVESVISILEGEKLGRCLVSQFKKEEDKAENGASDPKNNPE